MTERLAINPRHQVRDVDEAARQGNCSKCGQVRVIKAASHKGRGYWRCTQQISQRNATNYDRVREIQRQSRLKRTYAITVEDYDQMLANQAGVCARCKSEPQQAMRLAVDHCHTTGRIRGLLCGPCNTYLGRLEANMHMLQDDLSYFAAPLAERL